MRAWAVVENGAPLKELELPTPEPKGTEVLIEVTHCGVCHSDLHIWEGFFDLGMGQKLDVSKRGMNLPFTLGHEIAGEVAAIGPDVDAKDIRIGQRFVVFPWIGCGTCAYCKDGDELLCPTPRTLGTRRDGGYADYVIVPHPRYLVDHGNTPIDLACTYACSGLTAYSAIRKAQRVKNMKNLLIVGAGGVGLAALEVGRAIHDGEVWVADIDEAKLKIAREHGAHRTFNPNEPELAARIAAEGGADAAIDFVGAPASYKFAFQAVRRGGKLVMVGLFGGDSPLSLASMPLRMLTVEGSYVGNLDELQELMALVRAGKIQPMPYSTRPLEAANDVLDELKAGKVTGRVVLRP
jgi:D-arabinose 1-dehydrogenase-like Zn-dependent alcohol dehydrogenase